MRLPLLRLLIAVITLATYARLISCDFTQFDDPQSVSQNPRIHRPTLSTISYYWTSAGSQAPMGLYIPLTFTFWSLLAKITGVAPAAFHAANIALHILAVLAMFELLRVLIRHNLAAFAGALLFALHPVQVESVAWVSATKDLLCGLLSLLALWQYTLYAEQRPSKRRHYTIGLLCFILAMLSSPTGIVVPPMAAAIDLFFLRRQRNTVLKSLWPWFALTLPCAIWTLLSQPPSWLSPLLRPPIAVDALTFYLYKIFLPLHLCVDYGRNPQSVTSQGWIYYTWILPLVIAIPLLLLKRRWPSPLTASLLLFFPLLPVLGLIPFQFQFISTTADHYLYLAMLGPAFLAASLLSQSPRPIAPLATTLILLLLLIQTITQEQYWKNTKTLFQHTLDVNPNSFTANDMLGSVHYQSAEFQIAADYYNRAITLNDKYIPAHFDLASTLLQLHQPLKAEQQIQHVVELQPLLAPAQQTDPIFLAQKLVSVGDPTGAVRWLDTIIHDNPKNLAATRLRAQIITSNNLAPTTSPDP